MTAMARKFRATITTPHGPRVCFQATVERRETSPRGSDRGSLEKDPPHCGHLASGLPVFRFIGALWRGWRAGANGRTWRAG